MTKRFHVRLVAPNGWSYEAWPSAASEREAIAKADDLIDYVNRTNIRDFLGSDGLTAKPPAELYVVEEPNAPSSEVTLRFTRPDGTTIEK